MSDRPDRLILVYDGDSGVRAMLLDVVKKAVGREDCALCELTHSAVGKRGAWMACEARLGIAVEHRHRDELPPHCGIDRSALPCILASVGDAVPFILVSHEVILACQGSIHALEERIVAALADQPHAAAVHP